MVLQNMDNAIGVLLADSSDDFLTMLADFIECERDMYVAGVAQDGEETVAMARRLRPDVLVTDILLRRLDGIGAMRELRESGDLPRTIVVSAFFNDSIASEISRLGADYCFPKPCRVPELIGRIRECAPAEEPAREASGGYDAEITEALINFGVMPHLQGYRYLREGIKRNIQDRNVLHGVTKILYPDLAKLFHTNPKCVERSMRNAVETAWRGGDPLRRESYFGPGKMEFSGKPTNSRFIAMVTEFVLLRDVKTSPADELCMK